MTKGRHIKDKR